jgi:hypothetical protein
MTHNVQNFEIHAGDSREIVVTVVDSQGAAVDLTGATIAWHLAQSTGSGAPLVSKSSGDGIAITDALI